jgi:hypothetical protein
VSSTLITPKQQKLKDKHGTPAEFAKAVSKACDGLMITPEEEMKAIMDYNKEWEDAGR